jgi:hypothetical protein
MGPDNAGPACGIPHHLDRRLLPEHRGRMRRSCGPLVRGSAGDVRILVIDSCRSGAVTRVQGGTPAPPITLSDPGGTDEGVIVLTASAGEDAQESDALGGPFFTHYLLPALSGTADTDGDHRVTVTEAFQYTRDQSGLASARTLGGGPTVRRTIVRGATPCARAMIGATWARADLAWSPRLAACTGRFRNDTLSVRTNPATLDRRVRARVEPAARDARRRRHRRRRAAARAAHVDAGVRALVPLHGRYFLLAEVAVATHVFELGDDPGERALTPRAAVGGVIAIGAWQ